ncbi:hypothetical protein H8958_021361 [Nasalis larvatus]
MLRAPVPAPAMAPGAPSSSPSPILAVLLFSSLVLSPAQAIVVYTDREVHGAVGSRVTLHCSFWSSEWVSDDISFTWRYQPEGGRDAISTPVLYAMLDHSRSTKAASEKKAKGLGESRKDKK